MANQFLLSYVKEGAKYVIGGLTGTGVTLAMLLAWTGAEDLDAIKTAVNQTVNQSNAFTQEMSSSYLVEINKANAEIEDYQEALDQANANIVALKSEYDKMAEMVTEAEANEIIAKANSEIKQANEQVAKTKTDVEKIIEDSSLGNMYKDKTTQDFLEDRLETLNGYDMSQVYEDLPEGFTVTGSKVNTDGTPKVEELPEGMTVPTEQPQEQPQEQ